MTIKCAGVKSHLISRFMDSSVSCVSGRVLHREGTMKILMILRLSILRECGRKPRSFKKFSFMATIFWVRSKGSILNFDAKYI